MMSITKTRVGAMRAGILRVYHRRRGRVVNNCIIKAKKTLPLLNSTGGKSPSTPPAHPNCAPASKKAIKILSPQFLFVSENSPPAMTQSEIFNKTWKCFSFRFLSFLAGPSMATFI